MGFAAASRTPDPDAAEILLDGEGHLMTFAPTGAGKGIRCMIPALLAYEGSVVVIDPKGENYAVTARRRKAMGQQVHVLDPFGITGAQSDQLNPLDRLDPAGLSALDDADLLTGLCAQTRSSREPFWDDMACDLIRSFVLHVAHTGNGFCRSLPEVDHLLSQGCPAFYQTLDDMLQSGQTEVVRGANVYCGADWRVAASIRSTAQQHTAFLRSPVVDHVLSGTTIDVEAFRQGAPVSLYLVVPPHRLMTHGKLLRLWIGYLLNVLLTRTGRPERPTLFILDEAAQLGPLDQLATAITLMRGYGLRTWSFWQDMNQLRSLYPASHATLINNCALHLAFGLTTRAAASGVADSLGFDAPSDALLSLPPDQALLVRARQVPCLASLPDYLSEARFAGQFDPNPLYLPKDHSVHRARPALQGRRRQTPPPKDVRSVAELLEELKVLRTQLGELIAAARADAEQLELGLEARAVRPEAG